MNPIPELSPMLKQLRLSGILDSLEQRNRQAIDGKLAYTDFLALLIQDELARREQKKLNTRLARASFRPGKTLESFDFDRLPKLNRAVIQDLATGRYLQENANVLIAGPTGVGKSHLAQALGHCAARQGHDVLFLTQTKLLNMLHALVDAGNSMVVIEHNLDVIKNADWLIDMGPEGGSGGGQIVAEGTPEQVAKVVKSYTGQYLAKIL